MRKNFLIGALFGLLALVPTADAGPTAKKITLKLGEAVTITGTKMVCQYGGPAGKTAVTCGIPGASPGFVPRTTGITMNEREASTFEVKTAGSATKPTKVVVPGASYREPTAARQPNELPDALTFKVVGSIVPGDIVFMDGMFDLSCFSYLPKGQKMRVGCVILDQTDHFMVTSYGASVSEVDSEIVKFDANRVGQSILVRKQPCLPRTASFAGFARRTVSSINKLGKLGVKSKAPLKKAVILVGVDDFQGAAAALRQIKVSRLNLPPKKKVLLKKQLAQLVNSLAPKC